MFNSFYKNQLNDQEKIIYNKLLDGLKNMSPSISFISKVEIDVMKYFEYVLMDHVDIYYTYQFNYTYDYETKVYNIMPVYTIDSYLKNDYDTRIKAAKLKIVKEVKSMNKWDAVLNLHDYICKNVKYLDFGDNCHTLLGPLIQGRGVCDGISKMFKYICNDIFVQCIYTCGIATGGVNQKTEGHAWNKVNLDNEWYNMDVTFDIGGTQCDCISHTYFMADDNLLKLSHKETSAAKMLKCNSKNLSYYKIQNNESSSDKETIELIKKNIKHNVLNFEIKLNYLNINDNIEKVADKCIKKALKELYIGASYTISYGQQSDTVIISIITK